MPYLKPLIQRQFGRVLLAIGVPLIGQNGGMPAGASEVRLRSIIDIPPTVGPSTAKSPLDVLRQEDQVKIISRGRFELGDQMEVEAASLRRLGMHE